MSGPCEGLTCTSRGTRAKVAGTSCSSGSLCVRYLYDATGQIWFDSKQGLVPPAALNRKPRALAAAAMMAVAPVLFQACGGAGLDGYPYASAGATNDAPADPNAGAMSDGAANGEGGANANGEGGASG